MEEQDLTQGWKRMDAFLGKKDWSPRGLLSSGRVDDVLLLSNVCDAGGPDKWYVIALLTKPISHTKHLSSDWLFYNGPCLFPLFNIPVVLNKRPHTSPPFGSVKGCNLTHVDYSVAADPHWGHISFAWFDVRSLSNKFICNYCIVSNDFGFL